MPKFNRMLNRLLLIIIEPWHEISNNVVCATNKGSDQPAHTCRLLRAFASRLNILWLLSYWLSLKGGCTGSYESTLVKMPHCWKTHVTAQLWNSSLLKKNTTYMNKKSKCCIIYLFAANTCYSGVVMLQWVELTNSMQWLSVALSLEKYHFVPWLLICTMLNVGAHFI